MRRGWYDYAFTHLWPSLTIEQIDAMPYYEWRSRRVFSDRVYPVEWGGDPHG